MEKDQSLLEKSRKLLQKMKEKTKTNTISKIILKQNDGPISSIEALNDNGQLVYMTYARDSAQIVSERQALTLVFTLHYMEYVGVGKLTNTLTD